MKAKINMNELTIKRLSIIKQLYKVGVRQSYDSEPMNGFCLLSFHDSVEMFMKLCAEIKGVKVDRSTNFGDYFNKLADLQCQVTMTNLNNKRVALKHHGSLPSKLDVEISRVNVTDFFVLNTPVFFGATFEEISLMPLIRYDVVKKYIQLAIDSQQSKNYEDSVFNSHVAFKELLFSYENDKKLLLESPYKICENFAHDRTPFLRVGLGDRFDKFIDKVSASLTTVDNVVKMLGFGIDYKRYIKFKILSPRIQIWNEEGGRQYEYVGKNYHADKLNYNNRNAQYCIDFVIESALKLQEFDFDLQELMNE